MDIFIGLDFKSCFDLNSIEKVDLIEKSPTTDEIVSREELIELFDTKSITKSLHRFRDFRFFH